MSGFVTGKCILEGVGNEPRVEAAAKRLRAWVEVEEEIRSAIQAGVPCDEIGGVVAALLRKYGLEPSADRVMAGSRLARG